MVPDNAINHVNGEWIKNIKLSQFQCTHNSKKSMNIDEKCYKTVVFVDKRYEGNKVWLCP